MDVLVEPTGAEAVPAPHAYRYLVLVLLIVVYGFNFIDRQIVGMLAVPIKRDLGLSDTGLGLMGGLAFALLYTIVAIPVARLADRGSRTRIITLSLALWSLMTVLCGYAQNFLQLFAGRVGVGLGEAGGVAPSHALISDYFPPAERARALGLYALAVPLGSALGIVAGGYLATVADWRFALRCVGLAGLGFAPLFLFLVREPARAAGAVQSSVGLAAALRALVRNPSFVALALGAGIVSIAGYGVLFWLPSFFVRSFGLTLWRASTAYASVLAVGGTVGIVFGGLLADRLGAVRPSRYARLSAIAFVACSVGFAAALCATSLALCLASLLPAVAFALAWLGPTYASVQRLAGEGLRATAAAVFLFVVNLLGLGLGAPLIGALSDALKRSAGDDALRYAILLSLCCYPVGALCYAYAATRLDRDVRE